MDGDAGSVIGAVGGGAQMILDHLHLAMYVWHYDPDLHQG